MNLFNHLTALFIFGIASVSAQCDPGYRLIDSNCYWEPDLEFLEIIIEQSTDSIDLGMDDNDNGVIDVLELGYQDWIDDRLTELACYNCGLTGAFPENIGALDQLTELNLGSNSFHGPIPDSVENLIGIQILYLNGNNLTGSIPDGLGNLTSLQKLYLHENQLTGEIPQSFGNLSSLERLYLSMNQLSGDIPVELGNCTSLTRLYLRNNEFTGPIPRTFGNLVNLDYLLLHDNFLNGVLPQELGQLSDLDWLWLHNNHFSGAEAGICELNIEWDQASCGDAPYFMMGNNYICGDMPECLSIATFLNYGWNEDAFELVFIPQDCTWYSPGDINHDLAIDIMDVMFIVNTIIELVFPSDQEYINCDLNQDQIIDILDVLIMVNLILGEQN